MEETILSSAERQSGHLHPERLKHALHLGLHRAGRRGEQQE
jgi:hypothetical protein